jgi:hypothetical protein
MLQYAKKKTPYLNRWNFPFYFIFIQSLNQETFENSLN